MILQFFDEWGEHTHIVSIPGRAHNPDMPITCVSCIRRLDSVMADWLDKLTERESLPEGFWNGYKFPWSKQ